MNSFSFFKNVCYFAAINLTLSTICFKYLCKSYFQRAYSHLKIIMSIEGEHWFDPMGISNGRRASPTSSVPTLNALFAGSVTFYVDLMASLPMSSISYKCHLKNGNDFTK